MMIALITTGAGGVATLDAATGIPGSGMAAGVATTGTASKAGGGGGSLGCTACTAEVAGEDRSTAGFFATLDFFVAVAFFIAGGFCFFTTEDFSMPLSAPHTVLKGIANASMLPNSKIEYFFISISLNQDGEIAFNDAPNGIWKCSIASSIYH